MNLRLDERVRKEAFQLLVGLQDGGCTVEDSRKEVAAYYAIPILEVVSIEQEGIDKVWPPFENFP